MQRSFHKREKIKPTMGLNVFSYEDHGYKFVVWDIAGSKNYRSVWKNYYADCDLVIFMIDGSDIGRLSELRETLKEVLDDKDMNSNQILFLLNKNVWAGFNSG